MTRPTREELVKELRDFNLLASEAAEDGDAEAVLEFTFDLENIERELNGKRTIDA